MVPAPAGAPAALDDPLRKFLALFRPPYRKLFLLSLVLYANFDPAVPGLQAATRVPWIPAWGVNYIIGLDGYNILLVVLTTFLGPLVTAGAFSAITTSSWAPSSRASAVTASFTVSMRPPDSRRRPFAARMAPRNANGNANSVCSNLIIASVVRSLSSVELIVIRKALILTPYVLPNQLPSGRGHY